MSVHRPNQLRLAARVILYKIVKDDFDDVDTDDVDGQLD